MFHVVQFPQPVLYVYVGSIQRKTYFKSCLRTVSSIWLEVHFWKGGQRNRVLSEVNLIVEDGIKQEHLD